MSFYRTVLATFAALAIAGPAFADDADTTNAMPADNAAMQQPSADKSMSSADNSQTMNKVDVNKASAKDLMKVKGINASKARAIVSYRKKHGDFKSLDELAKVKGFSKMKQDKMQAIQNQLDVGP